METRASRCPGLSKNKWRGFVVLVAVVLVAVSALAIMNNACKSSQHVWCAPTSMRNHIKTG